jgi:hypothetical protein
LLQLLPRPTGETDLSPGFRFSVYDFYRTWAKWAKFEISEEFRKIPDEKHKPKFELRTKKWPKFERKMAEI